MRREPWLAAVLCGGAIVLAVVGVVVAASPSPDASSNPVASLTPVASEAPIPSEAPVRLSVGPPWFWGDKHPLAGLVGTTITVTGQTETGNPAKPKASAKAKDSGPEFEVLTVNGTTIRAPGKPPWAGGPKVVGPSHPGFAGWSKNHGNGNGPKATPKP